jgi:large subunit ribosomal protein L4
MRRAALRSALSVKAAASQIVLLDELVMAQPKTRDFVVLLERLGVSESTLVLLPEESDAVVRSVRNMPNVKALWASYLNVRDLLGYDTLLIPLNSLDVIQSILG